MIYETAFADQARQLCRLGATDEELAEHFEVCVRTIYRWRNTHEAFADAVVAGKDHADARVERALYSRAVGCTVERTQVFKHVGDADPVYATYQHHLPPDVNAALQWLRVRRPDKWGTQEKKPEHLVPVERIQRACAWLDDYLEENRARAGEAGAHAASGTPPLEPADPTPDPDHTPGPDIDSCHAWEEAAAGAVDPGLEHAPDPAPDPVPPPPPPPTPPPRPIPPGFPLERVRFGYNN